MRAETTTIRGAICRQFRFGVVILTVFVCMLTVVASYRPSHSSANAAAQCQFIVRPLTKSVAQQGGTGSLTVLAAGNCSWTATSNVPWIEVVGSAPGGILGPGRLDYFVFPNTETSQRVGTVTVAGQTLTLTQAGGSATACASPPITTGQVVNGTLTPGDCESPLRIRDGNRPLADRYSFNGVAGQPIVITLDSADLDTYLYLLDANGSIVAQNDDTGTGANSRVPNAGGFLILPSTGKFTIEVTAFEAGGQGSYALNLTIPVGNCTFALSAPGQTFPITGGTGSVTVNTQPGCGWTAVSNVGWVGVVTGASSSGSGVVSLAVTGHSGLARTGTLTIAGLTFLVTQSGTNGTACPTVSGVNPSAGPPGSVRTISGTNFTGVSSLRFTSDKVAQFAVVSDGQITTTTPSGAIGGPLIISKPTCGDVQTASVTIEGLATSVSAASYNGAVLAAESIAAVFGAGLAPDVAVAGTIPLPLSLLGTSVKVRDSASVERFAPLFFVSAGQINFQIPPDTATGLATLTVSTASGATSTGTVNIARTGPGVFTANASGEGIAAAQIYRVKGDGSQGYEAITQYDQGQATFVAIPIDLGPPTDQVFLVLYGTGIRNRSALSAVTASIGGVTANVAYAGAASGYVGLDQVNLTLSRALIGRGVVTVSLIVDGIPANAVTITIK